MRTSIYEPLSGGGRHTLPVGDPDEAREPMMSYADQAMERFLSGGDVDAALDADDAEFYGYGTGL